MDPPTPVNDVLCRQLIECGLREYDAKIYVALFGLGLASATELHKLTGIPRGRVYETLSYLQEKQFITAAGKNPVMYKVEDIHRTLFAVQDDMMSRIKKISECLHEMERIYHPVRFLQGQVPILTEGGIEYQFRLMCRRARSQIVILCNDAELLKRFSGDLRRVEKQVDLYVIVSRPEMAAALPFPCYMVNETVDESLFSPKGAHTSYPMLLQVFLDMRNMFMIADIDGQMHGFYTDDNLYKEFISRMILRDIRKI
ncbi:TrmB family transcriptional regulator [Methanofollis fontis]|uniref:Transcription regulator TrmB N-terminal domain-containing protein n=1 Tax=Methanofollis fontis TaxID=2052832 RepID=A0A483CWN6_9EURY|nr:helix-turn-helix domain-containing protein [Methanofollis fontis]TAJ45630.1 hypothetical protein CUJ86_02615 [Methanofollis fontis]